MPFPDSVVSYEAKHISRAALRGTVAFFSSQIDIVEVFPYLSPYRYLCIFRAMQSIMNGDLLDIIPTDFHYSGQIRRYYIAAEEET